MSYHLEPLSTGHFDQLHDLFDSVCREKRFLAFTHAGPKSETFLFYQGILDRAETHFVAIENNTVIGWCDVLRNFAQVRHHSGTLGMSVASSHRGKGIGRALIARAIDHASARGLSRIELTVHVDNAIARTLYESVGFTYEGTHQSAWLIDGVYSNVHSMARLKEA